MLLSVNVEMDTPEYDVMVSMIALCVGRDKHVHYRIWFTFVKIFPAMGVS